MTSFEVVLTRELEVLAIVKGCTKHFHPLKGGEGCNRFYPVLRGEGGHNMFQTRNFPTL